MASFNNVSESENWNYNPHAEDYQDEFYFFSNDRNNWNYNPFINTPNADPYNLNRTINITGNNSYNMMKYNAVIMLKEILKHTSQYLNDDVKQWIYKKTLQGTKSNYWDILSITTNLFYYYLFRTDETINYKKFRRWFLSNPLYINNSNIDNYPDEFLSIPENRRDYKYKEYLNTLTFKKLYNKVRDIEDHDIKYKFSIICDYLKDKIM
jgi:hypothetical protein